MADDRDSPGSTPRERGGWEALRRSAGYGIAIVATALSALLRWALPGALAPAPYLGFYPAVVVSAALGGVGPGLVSGFGSLLLVNFVFGRPNDHGAMARQLIWIVASVGVSLLAGKQRSARERERRAAQALREADRRKDEFLGMLSHELRNPLAPIRSSAYVLRHAGAGTEQARRAREVIERQTDHLTRLVDDLLDVTRIARGKIVLRRAPVDLREVVARAAEDFRPTFEARGVAFRVALPDARLTCDADATRLTQIAGNLLHNATKFTRSGDEVSLSLAHAGGHAELRVRDTGAGIAPELVPHVFDAFVQGQRTLARTEGGLGLGLALVKGMTELHGGTVRAASAGKGRGAEFVVRLPALGDGAAVEAPSPSAPPRVAGRRVLVVDDNPDAAESLAEIVKLLGHATDVALDGPSALEKARASPPEVVLCDLGLPGMSGYEVARALRGLDAPRMQLVAVSGYAQPEDVKRALAAGFDAHLAKPADLARLEQLLA